MTLATGNDACAVVCPAALVLITTARLLQLDHITVQCPIQILKLKHSCTMERLCLLKKKGCKAETLLCGFRLRVHISLLREQGVSPFSFALAKMDFSNSSPREYDILFFFLLKLLSEGLFKYLTSGPCQCHALTEHHGAGFARSCCWSPGRHPAHGSSSVSDPQLSPQLQAGLPPAKFVLLFVTTFTKCA